MDYGRVVGLLFGVCHCPRKRLKLGLRPTLRVSVTHRFSDRFVEIKCGVIVGTLLHLSDFGRFGRAALVNYVDEICHRQLRRDRGHVEKE